MNPQWDGAVIVSRKISPDELGAIRAAWVERVLNHAASEANRVVMLADGVRFEPFITTEWFNDGAGI